MASQQPIAISREEVKAPLQKLAEHSSMHSLQRKLALLATATGMRVSELLPHITSIRTHFDESANPFDWCFPTSQAQRQSCPPCRNSPVETVRALFKNTDKTRDSEVASPLTRLREDYDRISTLQGHLAALDAQLHHEDEDEEG
jgi:hypothetical protein